MKSRNASLILCCWVGLSRIVAQDAQLTQFYATPTYLNPAFAGTGSQTRFGLVARDQWPAIPGAFVTANFAIDHNLSNLSSGLGLMVHHDRAGSGALRYSSVTGQYAYEIQLKRKVFLRPALQVGWVQHAVDYSRLVFGDQLARGGTVGTHENMEGTSVGYADMGTGLLFFTPKMWLGAALHHLNRPNQSLLQNEAMVPMKFSMQGGYRIHVRTPVIQKNPQSFVFAFNYKSQQKYDQLDLGIYFEREPFFMGLWYRGLPLMKHYAPGYGNNDALAVLVGTIIEDLRIGYSYDITVSRLAGQSAGAHELTIGYEIASRQKKRAASKRRIVPCAKF
ncbi:MAG: type IX secretion system membrane protein PorP/SprF [Flavobacteriales bacterium]|jgi:type IX secretion system PorP/SprF family membrane protein|nr:type IX secretion system membrane protein PorP/SprF [Flavobacteriales bacterium]MBK7114159.1 type IX secretion system membrane protein PorP/SprF [Flavobacteriales bacterium]MBK8531803.1 type IX secretion system membrane protein PorP/SprF [Flavobacteriales bacterium]MBK9627467.1 type IX secretion system membrane protein PorP/SprF [Flavobacteriales bacterium]